MKTKKAEYKLYLKKPNTFTLEELEDLGLTAIENHHLTPMGLIKKMEVWDEADHGVEAYVYDLTKRDLAKYGVEMPKHIRRIKN